MSIYPQLADSITVSMFVTVVIAFCLTCSLKTGRGPQAAVIVKPEPQTTGPPTSSQGHSGSGEDDNPFGIDWEKML